MLIRPLTLLGCVAFLGTGFHVYNIQAEVRAAEAELRRTLQATEAEHVRTRTLTAEWARLTDQDRLQRLASVHLQELQPTTPQQFLRLAEAGRRLPPAAEFAGGPGAFRPRADVTAEAGEVLVFSARSMVAAARAPVAEPPAPPPVAAPAATAPPAATPGPAPTPATAPAAAPATAAIAAAPAAPPPAARLVVAARPPAPAPAPAPRAEPRPAPRLTEAPRAEPRPPVPAAEPALRTALHVRPAAPPAPVHSGSVLGGGVALPPPVPFGR